MARVVVSCFYQEAYDVVIVTVLHRALGSEKRNDRVNEDEKEHGQNRKPASPTGETYKKEKPEKVIGDFQKPAFNPGTGSRNKINQKENAAEGNERSHGPEKVEQGPLPDFGRVIRFAGRSCKTGSCPGGGGEGGSVIRQKIDTAAVILGPWLEEKLLFEVISIFSKKAYGFRIEKETCDFLGINKNQLPEIPMGMQFFEGVQHDAAFKSRYVSKVKEREKAR